MTYTIKRTRIDYVETDIDTIEQAQERLKEIEEDHENNSNVGSEYVYEFSIVDDTYEEIDDAEVLE